VKLMILLAIVVIDQQVRDCWRRIEKRFSIR